MRKYMSFLLAALLFAFPASGVEGPQYIGIAVQGSPDKWLLEAMEERDARATFFLDVPSWEQGRRILDGGHEIGLMVPEEWNAYSRREIYRELQARRALLPKAPVRLLLAKSPISDGVRQVVEVQKLTFLGNTRDPWAELPRGSTLLEHIQPGDILLLDGSRPELAIHLMDLLRSQGFRLVTVSELARFDRW